MTRIKARQAWRITKSAQSELSAVNQYNPGLPAALGYFPSGGQGRGGQERVKSLIVSVRFGL